MCPRFHFDTAIACVRVLLMHSCMLVSVHVFGALVCLHIKKGPVCECKHANKKGGGGMFKGLMSM